MKRVTYALPKIQTEITGNLLLIFARLIPFLPQTHNKLRRLEGRDGPALSVPPLDYELLPVRERGTPALSFAQPSRINALVEGNTQVYPSRARWAKS